MVTDGVVHDIPKDVASYGFNAPLHVLVTGYEGERDRRIELTEAPRFGLIGKDVNFEFKVDDANKGGDPIAVTVKRDGALLTRVLARPRRRKITMKIEPLAARTCSSSTPSQPRTS